VEGLHGSTKYNGLAESGAVLDPHIICKNLGDCPTAQPEHHLVRDEGVAGSNPATPTNYLSATIATGAQTKPLNSMQKALVELAANLPPAPGSNLQTHLTNLKATRPQPAPTNALASVHDARDYVKRQAGKYFQSH
jgi:hypothetical protein